VDERIRGIRDRELQEIFATATALPLAAFAPDPDEVTSLVTLDLEAAGALFRGEREDVEGFEMRDEESAPARITVRASDFVAAADGYYAVAERSLTAWLLGRPETAWTLG
jgi:hypothetical protein